MFRKYKKYASAATIALLLATGSAGVAGADTAGVDVGNSRAQVFMHTKRSNVSNDSAPVNENRDAGNAPVVQPVASMKGQTCIATGGLEVPCETDDGL